MTSPAARASDPRHLDAAVERLRCGAPIWARATIDERIALARSMLRGFGRDASLVVREGCAAKGIPVDSPAAGDEWLAAAYATIRFLRQAVRSLETIARTGNTWIGPLGETSDGRVTARVFPSTALDSVLFLGVRGEVHFLGGVRPRDVHELRARFHRVPDHQGRVCLVLGAGNVNSIAPADVATKLFNEGKVCVLKLNPVNAYLGPILEDAFSEAIARGFLAIVYGGRDEGSYLAYHPGVDEVHLTGSNATHDLIVWGPPGPERADRMARNDPLLRKEITSELGDVSPVLVVPGPWEDAALEFQAESVAGMVTQNGAFNCAAARLLVLPRGWRLRDRFLTRVQHFMATTPARQGWYPGAADRHRQFVAGRRDVRTVGGTEQGTLPWTLVAGLDADSDDPFYRTEAFCSVLAETSVGSEDPLEYLGKAVEFANERLWGTLSAQLVVHPRTLADPVTGPAVRAAIRRLRYGTIAVNCFSGYSFAFGTTPWGGFPGQPLTDAKSGRGFVHNTLMLGGVEKTVIWHPVKHPLKPPYFPSHRRTVALGQRLVALEGRGDWLAFPGVLAAGVRG